MSKVNGKSFEVSSAGIKAARRWVVQGKDKKSGNTYTLDFFNQNKIRAEEWCRSITERKPWAEWTVKEI